MLAPDVKSKSRSTYERLEWTRRELCSTILRYHGHSEHGLTLEYAENEPRPRAALRDRHEALLLAPPNSNYDLDITISATSPSSPSSSVMNSIASKYMQVLTSLSASEPINFPCQGLCLNRA
jgi:hypothetical protein